MSHCLVTGGAGFIGSHLTERLLAQGHQVTVLDNMSTGRAANLKGVEGHPRLRIINGSITDQIALADAVRGTDTIYHMAAAVGVKLVADNPVLTIETNIYPTEFLLRLAVQGGQRVYLASTSEAYGKNPKEVWNEEDDLVFGPTSKPRWAYGASKAIDEFLAIAYHKMHGLKVVCGRFFNVVGPRQVGNYGMVVPRFVDQALSGGPIVVYDDGSQIRCFAHVKEVVDCVIELTNTPAAEGRIFNIGSDQAVSVLQLAQTVIEKISPQILIEFMPYVQAYGENFEDVQRRVPCVDRLANTIGHAPGMELSQILDDVIAWKRAECRILAGRVSGDEV